MIIFHLSVTFTIVMKWVSDFIVNQEPNTVIQIITMFIYFLHVNLLCKKNPSLKKKIVQFVIL